MATPIDVAAAAAQIISLAFQTFQGCIEAYKFCRTAQLIGKEGDLLRTRLRIEQYRLESWADRAGLSGNRPDDRLNWFVIREVLGQQKKLLTSAEVLKKKYGLDLPEVNGSIETSDDDDGDDGEEADEKKTKEAKDNRGLDGLVSTVMNAVRRSRNLKSASTKTTASVSSSSSSSAAIAAANSTIRRLQWAAAGRDKMVKVLADLAALNSELERHLEAADRRWLQSGMNALLREVLSRSTTLNEVQALQQLLQPSVSVAGAAVASAADFKGIRLYLGVDKRDDEVAPQWTAKTAATMPRLKELSESKFVFDAQSRERLQSAMYRGRPVFVEWRNSDDAKYALLAPHMKGLALLLGTADSTFATLHCIGILMLPKKYRFGLVYEVPPVPELQPGLSCEFRTLYTLIGTQRKASLKCRIDIALSTAEAVLQLHTRGWLHKSIRSENIVFVAGSKSDSEIFLSGRPYLVGFDYSRPDTANSLTELPDVPLYTDLYRHPAKRGPAATGYRKKFDLYALACLLVELAVWDHIVNLFSKFSERDWTAAIKDAEASKRELKLPSLVEVAGSPAFIREVKHTAGPTYLEAIQLCLASDDESFDDQEKSLKLQSSICEKLRDCKV